MCFVHVLLNSLDLNEKGIGGKIILEGDAVTLIEKMVKSDNPLNKLYNKVKAQNLFIGACKACSIKLKMKDIMESEGIPLIGDMMGHPAMSEYIEQGYQILTF